MTPEGPPQAPMQLPNSVQKRGQLAGTRQAKIWYSSNPFMAAIQGIVIGLLENSVPILVIPLAALAAMVVSSLVPIGLSGVLSSTNISIVIAVWLGVQLLITMFALSLHLQLMIASFHQERISVHTALDRALQRPLGFFGVMLVCFSPATISLFLLLRSQSVTYTVLAGIMLLPSYFLIARFWLSAYFFYDRGDDLKTSLIDSWQLTSGRTFEMLGVLAAQFPLCFIGILSPLVASSGFSTRYFQLRYIKSHQLESSVRVHWSNYLLAALLVLTSAYAVLRRVNDVRDNGLRVCYVIDSASVGAAQQVCQTKLECDRDPVCHSRDINKDPTFTIVR